MFRSFLRARRGESVLRTAVTAYVDLGKPLRAIDARGTDEVFLVLRSGGQPIGSVRVPAPGDVVPPLHLADAIVSALAPDIVRNSYLRRPVARRERVPEWASVVVCSADRPEQLAVTLASIDRNGTSILEVIVVDNSKTRSAETMEVAAAAGARCVREPVPGLDRARNRGISVARGEVTLFTDDDVEVDEEWGARLLDCFADPRVMAATGLVLPARLDTPARFLSEDMASHGRGFRRRVFEGPAVPSSRAGAAGAGASMAFRTDFLRSIGGFPPELDAGTPSESGGDTFALFQVLQTGYRIVYEPGAVAFHLHRDNDAGLRRMLCGYGTGTVAYLTRTLLDSERPAPIPVALRGLGSYASFLTKRAAAAFTGRTSTPPLPHALDEWRGIARAVRAIPRSRRELETLGRGVDVARSPMPVPLLDHLRLAAEAPPAVTTGLPSVSVIVPTRGRREQVSRLLLALGRQHVEPGSIEVIVVVDGDVDGTAEAIAGLSLPWSPRVLVLDACGDRYDDGQGAAHARNRGAAVASNEVLLFLDDDLQPLGPYLVAAHARAQAEESVLAIGPCPVDLREARSLHAQTVRAWWTEQTVRLLDSETLHFTDALSGNMSLRRELFERVGGFHPMPRREDWDLACAVQAAGVSMRAIPEAAALQDVVDRSLYTALADRRREGAGDVELARRHVDATFALPLARYRDATGRDELLSRAALRYPGRVDGVIRRAAAWLSLLEAAGSRGRYQRQLGRLSQLSYWAGVSEAVGGEEGWNRFVDTFENLRPAVAPDFPAGVIETVYDAGFDLTADNARVGPFSSDIAGGGAAAALDEEVTASLLRDLTTRRPGGRAA